MKQIFLLTVFVALFFSSKSQNLSYTCPRDTILGCNSTCLTLKAQFPDVRGLGNNYTFQNATSISVCRPYDPPDVVGPSTNLTIDDRYSDVIPIGFPFPFYGTTYNNLIVSTNGYISFDVSLALGPADWILNGNVPNSNYDGALVMGPWHDLDPSPTTSPNQQIKYNVVGTAPTRKWVLSFYRVPLFSVACNDSIYNTQQIVLHESTGVIEVFIIDKQICATWNGGQAMVGLQDITKTKGIVPPGRGATDPPWGFRGMNEVWRFIPTGGAPLYRSVELLDATGAVVATGDTTRVNANTFETNFPNICPPAGASFYVVKTTYEKLNDPTATIFSLDTINIIRQAALPVTATMTPTTCGASTGTVTVTAAGTAPYQYSIDGGTLQNSNVFTNIGVGTHTIYCIDNTGCNNTITIDVTSISSLPSTFISTNPSCAGVNNGTITVTPTAGTGPYTYTIDGGVTTQPTGIFSNLGPGSYSIQFTDINLCTGTTVSIPLTTGVGLTATESHSATTCAGATDGTITITPDVPGTYTFTLSPGAITNSTGIFTGLATNTYSVAFSSISTGCSGTKSGIVISQGTTIPATWIRTNETCPNVHDGTIQINPTAVGTYTYTLTPGPITNSTGFFTGLSAGIFYNVSFTNLTSGCSGSMTNLFVQASSAVISGTAAHTDATCPGVNDGTITITPVPVGTYSYTLTPGGTVNSTGVFTGLAPNTYSVAFQNAGGCGTTVNNIIVASISGSTTSATPTNATCTGVSDGIITVLPPASGGPFIYTLNPGNIVQNNNPVFTGLAANTYTITYTIAAGCGGTVTPNTVVGAGASPTATALPANTTCPGVDDGTITITPPATGGPFTYTANPGNIVQNNNPVFVGLPAATYTITFTNAAGCIGTVTTTPTVGIGAAPTTTASGSVTTCPGVNDGTVTVVPPATGGPFTYTLNPGAITNSTGIFTGLAPNSYTITFTTAAGCVGTVTSNPVVTTGAAPTTTASGSVTTCPGVNDGTVTVVPPATGGPFTYTLNPGAITNSTGIFTGLAPNSYTITFTTAAGCVGTVTSNPVVTTGAAPTTTASATATTCPGVNDGIVTVTPPAIGAPFVYTLNPGAITNSTGVFTGLAPNIYTISFTTAAGCSGVVNGNLNLVAGAPLSGTATPGNPPCANINDGTVTIVPSLAGIYTYVLNPGLPTQQTQANDPVFTGLAPGVYTYSFTNASGCIGGGSVTLTTNSPITTTVGFTMPLCNGNADGVITLNASGGVAPYQYALSPFTTYQTGTFNGLPAGTYTFRIKDNVGCTKDTTVTLLEPSLLTASASSTQGTCNGNDGSILVSGNGGTPAYQYSIDNGVSYQASNAFVVSGGTFPDIKVKDSKGCVANTSVVVTLVDNMVLVPLNDTTICAEQTVTLQPNVSTEATLFVWTTIPDSTLVNTLNDDSIKNPVAAPLDTTTYVLHAQWGVCFRRDTITVNMKHKPIPYAGKDTAVCFDNTISFLHGSASNLSGTVNYAWSDTTNLQTPHDANTVATPPVTETFTLTVTDNYGCNFSVTDEIKVTVQPPVPAFAGNDTIAINGQAHELLGSGGVGYLWSPSYPLNSNSVAHPLATLTNDQQFSVIVTDVAGCIGYDTVFVRVYPGPSYHVPNAFSPNGDGLNDVFRVVPAGISYTQYFRIFNRFGELVFETNQWLKGWDGTYKGKKQPLGNYVWILKGVDRNGKTVEMKGTVLLIQ